MSIQKIIQIVLGVAFLVACVWAYQSKGQLEPMITALSTLAALIGTLALSSISTNNAKIKAKGNVKLHQSHAEGITHRENNADVETDGTADVVQK